MTKLFSLQQANKMLPLLESITKSIVEAWDRIIVLRQKLQLMEQGAVIAWREIVDEIKAELNQLIDKINGYIKEVEDLGCFVEEFRRGIINFPTLHYGRKVFLCWALGETVVAHWHELDEAFDDSRVIRSPSDFLQEEKV